MTKSIIMAAFVLAATAAGGQKTMYDRYGGWTGLKGKRAGFFHTEKIGGKWWLVSPEGSAFFSKGVCHVAYGGDIAPALGYSPYKRAAAEKYGSAEEWAKATVQRLRGWGVNTVGAWSSPELYRHEIAYAPILDLAAQSAPDLWLKGGFPDVFAPEFRQALDRAAKRLCAPRRADPWLLGYFTDNELRWGPDWRSKDSLLETFLKMPENAPGRQEAEAFLREMGDPDATLNDREKAAFLEKVAREYFKLCHDAIRRHDPNHLILGCRFAGYAPDSVLRGMREFVDVVSFNNYSHEAPAGMLQHLTGLTGKPVMVTEFSFKAMDSGLPNTKGAGEPVATQQERAGLFERYVESLAKLPNCVGYHWFEWSDEPKEGRFDGENSNYGLVKIDDTAWEVLTERFRTVNARLEKVR
jgi:hypothetical protein